MNKLDELINQLCPDGVEFVPLWSVTIWDKKFNSVDRKKQPKVYDYPYLLAADLFKFDVEGGDVFLLSTGEQTGWTTEELAGENLREGEVVTMPWGKSRAVTDCIKYYKGKFVTADNRIMTSNNTNVLSNRYLYYWFMSVGKVVDAFYRGSGIKHPDMSKVLDLKIPLPPLEVQSEIVRILDNFTELTAELTAELASRKKQYSYYSDALFPGVKDNEREWAELGSVAIVTKLAGFEFTKYVTYSNKGSSIALRGLNVKNGHLDLADVKYIDNSQLEMLNRSKLKANDMLFTYVGTVGQVALIDQNDRYYLAPNVALVRITSEEYLPKYVMYYFLTDKFKTEQVVKLLQSSSMQNIPMEKIRKFKLPRVTLEEQKKVVEILDQFDSLCNGISEGLPAEIDARQKQYEFYRDKLLSLGA